MTQPVAEKTVRFPLGVRQALAWAIGITSRDGYVSPSVTRLMGGSRATGKGLSQLEQHGEAAFIVAIVDREPEPYQQVIWFNANVLPRDMMEALAVALVPQVIRQMPTGVYNRRAVQMAILNTIARSSKSAVSRELKVRNEDGCKFVGLVAEKLEALSKVAEANVGMVMAERGLV